MTDATIKIIDEAGERSEKYSQSLTARFKRLSLDKQELVKQFLATYLDVVEDIEKNNAPENLTKGIKRIRQTTPAQILMPADLNLLEDLFNSKKRELIDIQSQIPDEEDIEGKYSKDLESFEDEVEGINLNSNQDELATIKKLKSEEFKEKFSAHTIKALWSKVCSAKIDRVVHEVLTQNLNTPSSWQPK